MIAHCFIQKIGAERCDGCSTIRSFLFFLLLKMRYCLLSSEEKLEQEKSSAEAELYLNAVNDIELKSVHIDPWTTRHIGNTRRHRKFDFDSRFAIAFNAHLIKSAVHRGESDNGISIGR